MACISGQTIGIVTKIDCFVLEVPGSNLSPKKFTLIILFPPTLPFMRRDSHFLLHPSKFIIYYQSYFYVHGTVHP